MLTFAISDGLNPLPGATVEFDGIQNITGTGGTVTFAETEPGKIYSYTISKSGYDSISGTTAIRSDTVINIMLSLSSNVLEFGSGKISFFPNPANDKLFLSSTDEMNKVIVMDLFGKVINNYRVGADSFSFGTGNLSPGIYLIRVQMQNGEWLMGRFVIGR